VIYGLPSSLINGQKTKKNNNKGAGMNDVELNEYLKLRSFATPVQNEILDALVETKGNATAASKILNKNHRNTVRSLQQLKDKAARQGWSPDHDMTKTTPEGMRVAGVSTLYDEDGNLKIQWVKTAADKTAKEQDSLKNFAEGLCDEVPKASPVKIKKSVKHDPDLMSGIFIGDTHLGMKAYGKETRGGNFDMDICIKNTRDAVDDLISKAPNAETGLLVDVGDFMHANSSLDTTFKGTKVDVDTRHHVVMREAALLMRYCVDRMLEKFKKVVVVVARGNHNTDVAPAVQLMLSFFYEDEPRVNVLQTDGFFHYLEYGSWLIGVNHGDKIKPAKLASVMARDMNKAWGRTTHKMWAVGHFHHQDVLETDSGVIVQKFAALPPPDSWHASMGYSSQSAMQMITFKRKGGKHSTHIFEIERPDIDVDVRIA